MLNTFMHVCAHVHRQVSRFAYTCMVDLLVAPHVYVIQDMQLLQLRPRQGTLLHFQWTGSDANNNGNAGNGRAGTDRSNLVQVRSLTESRVEYWDLYRTYTGCLSLALECRPSLLGPGTTCRLPHNVAAFLVVHSVNQAVLVRLRV